MKLLAEIIGMPTQCNLRCSYCDWKMQPITGLDAAQAAAAARRIQRVGQIVRDHYPTTVFVEYSGGEPLVYPAIVEALLDTFADRWVRISTNGTLIRPAFIERIRGRKVYLAMSLDGHTAAANQPRFHGNDLLLGRVQGALAELVSAEVPVMLLCTLNQANIDQFPAYVQDLERRYPAAIAAGRLTLPAHAVSEYDKPNGRASIEQVLRLSRYVAAQGESSALMGPILAHYQRLVDFLCVSTCKYYLEIGQPRRLPAEWIERYAARGYPRTCFLHDWQVSFHFLDDAIAGSGAFRGYGCGMRGVGDLGTYRIGAPDEEAAYRQVVGAPVAAPFDAAAPAGRRCPRLLDCFVDWNAVDLIVSGAISLERAGAWFAMFRDPQVAQAILQAQAEYGAAGAEYGAAGAA